MKPEYGGEIRAGALSIGSFERGRWRLRRTRHLWVFNRFGDFWDWRVATGGGIEFVALRPERRQRRAWELEWDAFCLWELEWDAFCLEWGTLTRVWAHVEPACRS